VKKAIKFLGFGLLALVALIGLGAGYVQVKGVPTYPYAPSPEISSLKVPLGDAATLQKPMPPFVTLSDSQVAAIHAYLKTVPVIDNKIK
jgi:mono/diheme cytochrome c family protein